MDTPTPATPALVLLGAFVPPHYDLLFKKVFSDERNTDLLVELLRPVLSLPDEDCTAVALPDTHTLADDPDGKTAVFDVKVTTGTGKQIAVEVVLSPTRDLPQRLVYYNASMVTAQMVRGAAYGTINQTICLAFVDFVMFDDDELHHRFAFHDREHGTRLTDTALVHVIELPKLSDEPDGTVEWRWLKFLAANSPEEMAMAAGDDPHITRAATVVRRFNADEQFRYELEARERFLHDQASREHTAHLDGYDEGRVEVARSLLGAGMAIEQVAAHTGLDVTKVTQLSREV
ncbi:MAG: Rpn family recombination-promoting nuclease/putative transposase [Micrococcales bacterium]|nr:Rpn family recombination-promoting nuclease/putative transposase [Micrococcales bacterium]MCL2669025.1 Rpn family recombination-promoting nuclease/putative transposase [Micrococcales bacterium]